MNVPWLQRFRFCTWDLCTVAAPFIHPLTMVQVGVTSFLLGYGLLNFLNLSSGSGITSLYRVAAAAAAAAAERSVWLSTRLSTTEFLPLLSLQLRSAGLLSSGIYMYTAGDSFELYGCCGRCRYYSNYTMVQVPTFILTRGDSSLKKYVTE